MADPATLSYPKKSHRKQVTLPQESAALAEFFGIMMGDGGINNQWQANITLNSVKDAQYAIYVQDLIGKLFGVAPRVMQRKGRNALVISIASTTIVDFLVERGLKRGDKLAQGLAIPEWIMTSPEWRKASVRGLVDTDGCLYIHKHFVEGKPYRNLGFTFCSYSSALIKQVAQIFEEFGIIAHISNQGRSIYLYKASAVAAYLEIFGTSNERILSVYREYGGVG